MKISRREFLKGLVAGAAVAAMPSILVPNETKAPDLELEKDKWHHIYAQYDGYNTQIYVDEMFIGEYEGFQEISMNGQKAFAITPAPDRPVSVSFWFAQKEEGIATDQFRMFNRHLQANEVSLLSGEIDRIRVFTPEETAVLRDPKTAELLLDS